MTDISSRLVHTTTDKETLRCGPQIKQQLLDGAVLSLPYACTCIAPCCGEWSTASAIHSSPHKLQDDTIR